MKQGFHLFFVIAGAFSLTFCYLTIKDRMENAHVQRHETNFYICCQEPKGFYTYTIDEYILGMILAMREAQKERYLEAQKAFAIVCRTILWQEWEKQGRKNCIEVKDMPHITRDEIEKLEKREAKEEEIKQIRQAIEDTSYLIINAQNEIGYCSLSNGNVRSIQSDYVISCEADRQNVSYYKEKRISKEHFLEVFGSKTRVSQWNILRDKAGYVEKVITEQNQVIEEMEIRDRLGLSSDDWEVREEEDSFVFCMRGLGHGYNFSISYSNELASKQKNFEEIILYFFPENHLERRYRSE